MRLRIIMLIVACVALDVLVVRQVRKYDEQKTTHAYERAVQSQEATVVSHKEAQAGQRVTAYERERSSAA